MPIRVQLVADAVEDLRRVHKTGAIRQFLAKLVRLEEAGPDVGQPLRGALAGWRKIVVGDRTWRILFLPDKTATVATIWVIGDRADEECYREAMRRLDALKGEPEVESLAAALGRLIR